MTGALATALFFLVCAAPVTAQHRVATESINAGGGDGASASYRIHDSIGQGVIGPMGEGGGMRSWDGLWLTLPNINVPVEGSFFGSVTDAGSVMLRWTVPTLSGVEGFNVYRSLGPGDDYVLVNEEPLEAASPGAYEDATVWPETEFWYELRVVRTDGTEEEIAGSPIFVEVGGRLVAALHRPYPNPFRGQVNVRFDVPSDAGDVRLRIYNVRGQVVTVLEDGEPTRGRHTLTWDGRDRRGNRAAAGVYFVRYEAAGKSMTEKVLALK